MSSHAGTYVVAEGGLDNLKSLQRVLRSAGMASDIVAPPKEKCSS